jgi:hypothetical protein
MVTPADLAQAIGVSAKEADDVLTAMAKESPDHVSIEVDDNGAIYYRFSAAPWTAIAPYPSNGKRPSAGYMAPNAVPGRAGTAPPPHTRVADPAAQNMRVDPRDPIEDELTPPPAETAQRQAR